LCKWCQYLGVQLQFDPGVKLKERRFSLIRTQLLNVRCSGTKLKIAISVENGAVVNHCSSFPSFILEKTDSTGIPQETVANHGHVFTQYFSPTMCHQQSSNVPSTTEPCSSPRSPHARAFSSPIQTTIRAHRKGEKDREEERIP
jgi:hypothetical protein